MDPIPLKAVVEAVNGRWLGPGAPPDTLVRDVGTDSRCISPGALFVPLRGKSFDGREFIGEALRRGAAASLVEAGPPPRALPPGALLIEVDEAMGALERLSAWWRDQVQAEAIAITGTVGKTTTKDFLGLLLSTRFTTVRAPKSFNNRLGVALTLLSARRSTRFIVAEVGTSAPGELSRLSRLVRPTQVVITEIGHAHLVGLGSLDGVIRAKAEVFEGLRPGGTAFIQEGAPGREELSAAAEAARAKVILFGWGRGDFRITACRRLERGDLNLPAGEVPVGFRFRVGDPEGFEEELIIAVPGRHNVLNALGAIAAARRAGLDWAAIRAGVRELCLPPGRFEVGRVAGVTVIDDTYNGNHRSALAAIEEAAEVPLGAAGARRFLVLGDLLELGPMSEEIHREIGRQIAMEGRMSGLVAVGSESRFAADAVENIEPAGSSSAARRGLAVHRLERVEEVAGLLEEILAPGDLVIFKASRAVGLERAVEETRRRLARRSGRIRSRKTKEKRA